MTAPVPASSCEHQGLAPTGQATGSLIRIYFDAPVAASKQLCVALIDGAKQAAVAGQLPVRNESP